MATAVELAVGYLTLTPELRGVGPAVRRGLGEAEDEAGRSGGRMGSGMSDSLSKKLMVGAAGIGLAAGAIIGKSLSTAMENEVTTDKLAAGLGATADQAKAYGAIAGKVYSQAYGENLGDVTTAIDSVASSLKGVGGMNLDDGSIERLTKKSLDFAAVYGTDVAEQVQLVNQLVGNGLADSADQGFDMLTRSFQKVPAAMRGELPEILSEYGTNFRALGFEGEEAFNLLIGAAGQGKFVLDKTGDALKEFTIRGSDMSKASSEAYAAIGLSAEDMSKQIAGGGDGAQKALQQTAQGLLGIADPAERANTAIALFGTPLEDLSVDQIPAFLSSLAGAPDAMGEVAGAADQMGATLNDNAATNIEGFKRSIMTGLTDLVGGGILPTLSTAFSSIGGILSPVVTEVSGGITAMVAAFQDGGDEVTSSGFAGFLEGLGVTARNLWDTWQATILPALKDVGAIALDVGQAVLPVLWGAFTTGVGIIASIAETIGSVVGWFTQHKDVAISLAAVIGTLLLPALLTFTGTLVAQGIAWAAATASAIAYNAIGTALSVATKIWAAGQWLLNAALSANPIGLIIAALVGLVAGIVLAYKNSETFRNIVQAAWEGIQTAVSAVWGFLQGVFASFIQGFKDMGSIAAWLWNNAIKPAWDGIQTAISAAWGFIQGVFESFMQGFRDIGSLVTWFYDTIIAPYFNLVGTVISTVVDGAVGAFGFFMDGLGKVGDFVGNVVDGIASVWDGLRSILAKPINFLINTVWNDGILKAWNAVADFLPGIEPASPLAGIPEHATGGAIGGKGGIDNVLMWGTRNEHMLTVDEVNKAGGHGAVYAIRDMIARGIPFSWDNGQIVRELGKENLAAYGNAVKHNGLGNVDPAGMFNQLLPGYKDGGAIEPWHEQLANGHRAAQSRNGNPYTWGFEDCSGYMSMIADAIINGGNGVRRWATSSFPGGQPWQPGLGEGFSVGVHDDPGGPGGGHTAGTLSAVGQYSTVNVESGGSHGNVAYGGPAAGADSSQFVGVSPGQYHLAIGANGFFQSGGAGGGTGPSPAEQSSFLTDKIRDVFNGIVSPIRSGIVGAIGAPPPEYLGLPPKFLDTGVDLTSKFLGDSVGNLGELLSSAWQGAKNLVGNLFDSGGVFPNNSIGINTSGKPEAVLTNDQWSLFKEFNDVIATVGPEFMEKMSGIASTAGLEILGLDGTLLDPEANRYLKAGQEIAKTAQEFQAKRVSESAEVVQPVVNNDYSVNINNPTFQDQNQALRDAGAMQQRSMMRNAGRP